MLDISRCAKQLSDYYDFVKTDNYIIKDNEYHKYLEKVLDNEFQLADQTHTNIDITTVKNTLKINYSNEYNYAYDIAYGICEYWSRAIMKSGIPEAGGIEDVSNNAMNYVNPLKEEILSIDVSQILNPGYYRFIEIIYKYVKMIRWIVVEKYNTFEVYVF